MEEIKSLFTEEQESDYQEKSTPLAFSGLFDKQDSYASSKTNSYAKSTPAQRICFRLGL